MDLQDDDAFGSSEVDEQSTTSGSSMNPDKHPSDQEIEQMATKQDTESKSAFKIDEILSELQGANLHLSIHVHQIPEETVDGNTDSKTESKQDVGSWIVLQDSAPTCSKLLEPLVESGLVVMEDIQKQSSEEEVKTNGETSSKESDDEKEQKELLLKDFINELQEVIDWFYLGMCLDVPLPTLLTIKKDLRNTDECRTRMLEAWMNQEEEPTWSKIVAALREMKKTALAEQIASKFDVASAPEPETEVKPGGRSVVPLNMTYIDSSQELPGDLVKAMKEVKAWYKLGLCLDVPVEVLQEIKNKRISPKKRARKLIVAWMEKEISSWDKLVRALDDAGATSLACKVANRYGVRVVHKPGEGVPSVEGLSDPTWESVKANPEEQTVFFHKESDGRDCLVWDFSIPEVEEVHEVEEVDVPCVPDAEEEQANLKDLVSELQEVTDWFHLGICLGILLAKLQSIKQDYRHIDERRREVLLAWRDNEDPTWSKLVSALVDMRNISLAYQIAGKYGVPAPTAEYVIEENQQSESETAVLQPGERKPRLKDLLRELKQVTEWKHLGQLLGLSESDLEAIYEENETTEDCRREMLLLWMERDPDCSWKKIVDALIEMKAEALAAQIASRYDVPVPQSVKDLATAEAAPQELGIASPTQTIVGVAMRDLLSELQELTNWFYFGVCVGVHQATLKEIRQDYEDTEECKREMLAVWRNKEIATWSKVIRALAEVGMPRLALEIASKYGETVPLSLQEAVDRMKRDVAEAQMHGATEKEVSDSVGQSEEERIIPDYEGKGGVKLKDLVNELQEVTDWLALGVYLGLEMSTLESVRADSMGIDEGRRSMLGIWMREQEATWSKVVDALVQMKLYYIAVQIASKYKAPIAKSAVKAMRGKIPEGELKILEVVQGEEETDSESSSDEEGEDEAEMRDLILELEEVTEWDYLGVCLGVPGATLRAIRRDERGAESRKRAMLMEWAKIKKPTWYRIVHALLEMGMEVLAKRIAAKYDIPVPKNVRRRRRPEHLRVEEEEEQEAQPPMAAPVHPQMPPPMMYPMQYAMPPPVLAPPMPPPVLAPPMPPPVQVQMAADIPRPDYPGPHSFLCLAIIVTCIGALLNFPSFLCGIAAIAIALRSYGLSNAGYYARAKRYANVALFCIMCDIIYTLGVAVLGIALTFGLYYYFDGYRYY